MRAGPQIRLLGEGLDAIVIATGRPRTWFERLLRLPAIAEHLRPTCPADRLARYRDAAQLHPMYRDELLRDRREWRGWNYLKAWRAGSFPKVLALTSVIRFPKTRTPRRASSARG